MRATLFAALFFSCVSLAASISKSDDWPQWRGPDRDGTWNEPGIVSTLPDKPDIKWRVPIGSGYSGPTVAAGRVYVMDRKTDPQPVERVLCFDITSGKEIWKHEYRCEYRIGYPAGPRASVTIDSGLAFSHGAMGRLLCIDAAKGNLIWDVDLNEKYSLAARDRKNNRMPIWGMACSPIVYDNKVIVQVGGKDAGVVAFDVQTGKEVWRATDSRGQYSSPVLTRQGNQDVLVCWTGADVTGLSPKNGTVFWSISWTPRNMPIGCASPIIKNNMVFCTSFYDGSMLIRLDSEKTTAEKVYHRVGASERQTDALHSIISTPIWLDEHIYGVDSYGEFRCLNAMTGDRVWEDKTAVPKARWGTIHFVQNGDDIWMFNERGELIIGRLSPSGFDEKSRLKIIEPTKAQLNRRNGVCWSHPAFAEKCVFARNDKELICIDLSE